MKHFTAYSEQADKRVDLYFNSLNEAKAHNPSLRWWREIDN